MICTGALVLRQDICQERAWRRMEEGSRGGEREGSCLGSPTASGPSWACSGARSLSHFTAQWGLQTWHCYEPRGQPSPPHLLPCPLSLPSFNPSPCLSPLHLPGASLPSRAGQQSRHRALLCRHSHLTQCGTTWLITNPILGALRVGRGCSVLLSHFIRAITGHFGFCLRVNVLSDTLDSLRAGRGDSRGS